MKTSDTVNVICDSHFDSSCKDCPLYKACMTPIPDGGVMVYIQNINDFAETITLKTKSDE